MYIYIYTYVCVCDISADAKLVPCVVFLEYCQFWRNYFVFKIIVNFAGGSGPPMSPLPTKLFMSWEDIRTDDQTCSVVLKRRCSTRFSFCFENGFQNMGPIGER